MTNGTGIALAALLIGAAWITTSGHSGEALGYFMAGASLVIAILFMAR